MTPKNKPQTTPPKNPVTSLAVKYRPRTLDDMRGNAATVAAVRATIGREDIPHALLFTGPSGAGKTTLARIVANALRCAEHDLCEQNAADFRGIDSVRDILRTMQLAPMVGPCRVWLLDEAHQLSKDAQSALLKALEEPPKHVWFMLATTDPDKLLPTIRTRCITFTVEALGDEEMTALLLDVIRAEGGDIPPQGDIPEEAVAQIVQDSLGSARMALSVLDKVIGMDPADMQAAAAQSAAEQNDAIALCRALIARRPWREVARTLVGLGDQPEVVERTRRAVLGYASATLLKTGKPQAFLVLSAFSEPTYNTGKPGLVRAAFEAVQG